MTRRVFPVSISEDGYLPFEILGLKCLYVFHGCQHGDFACREDPQQLLQIALSGHGYDDSEEVCLWQVQLREKIRAPISSMTWDASVA